MTDVFLMIYRPIFAQRTMTRTTVVRILNRLAAAALVTCSGSAPSVSIAKNVVAVDFAGPKGETPFPCG